MNLTYLKYFYDVANSGSTQEAAKLNHVSQPAISQGVKKLEQDIELQLLNHKRNSIEVTKDGKAITSMAKKLFFAVETFKKELDVIKNGEQGEFNIGISSSIVSTILSPTIKSFSKKFPHIEINIKIGKTLDQIDLLERGDIDLGITIDNGQLDGYQVIPLKKGIFKLFGTKNSPKRLLITELRPEIEHLYKAMNKNIFKAESQIESWSSILELVKSNYGIGLLPDFLINEKKLISYNEAFKIKESKYEIVCFYKKKNNFKAMKNFIQVLEEVLTQK